MLSTINDFVKRSLNKCCVDVKKVDCQPCPWLHPGFRIRQITDSKTGCVNNVKEFMKMVDHSEDEELEYFGSYTLLVIG
jgi:hypothetical protein